MPPKKKVKTGAGDTKSQAKEKGSSKTKVPPTANDENEMSVDESPAARSKTAKKLADTFEQPAKQKRQNPIDLPELRNQIYRDILRGVPSDGDYHPTIITLDSNGDLMEKAINADETNVLDVVPKSGVAKVFKLGLAQLRQLFTEFLSENAPEMTFLFKHAGSLDNFAELLNAYLMTPQGQRPVPITVAISLFSDRKKFAKMAEWQDISMAHGYKEKAEEHFKEWMDAVQSLPRGIKLILNIDQPWFDYRSLRAVTTCLRAPDAVCTTEVAVARSAWENVPDREFHLKLTVVSIQGGKAPGTTGEVHIKDLIKHGCRGFRGEI